MPDNMASLTSKLHNLNLCIRKQDSPEMGYGRALTDAIAKEDIYIETETLKSLGDLHLQKGKLGKDSSEIDKAAALYGTALLRCTNPDMGETLEHRIGYMEKLSRQLLQGYTPHFRWLSSDYWGTADSNALRVAEICNKVDRSVEKSWRSLEELYAETLVNAIANGDSFLENEVLKSLGDLYLEKGQTASGVSQIPKATAMYNRVLTGCGDPETKQVMEHRIMYTEKIRKDVKRRSSRRKSRPTEGRPISLQQQYGNITKTDFIQDQHLHPDIASNATIPGIATNIAEDEALINRQYNDYLKEGESSLARADLDSAEQHFAAALKTVHVRDSTAQQYQREVEPLCKLGDVYSKRGQQTGDGGDFVKAAALYNAAIARSEDEVTNGKIEVAIKEVEKSFLRYIFGIHYIGNEHCVEKHKKQLKEMRDQIKLEIETIDQQLDPYVHDEDDPCVREIEAKRAQAVRQLFERIAEERRGFISQLVDECIGLMGPPPCKYALIGLGSQATGLVTPYSDLEFAILVEEENEQYLAYFRNLTHYLHLKVVNLGETILPALGIKSLNDFYSNNPLDSWYYDSATPRGFAFDGSMPKASKTPLGLQEMMDKPPSELICTPQSMISKLQKDATLYLKEGYHLATILRNPCLIAGDQDLIDMYMAITVKTLQADGGKIARQLAQETLKENIKSHDDKETVTAKIIDVKKDIYRFPGVAVDCLALSSSIIPTTVWKTIEDMEIKKAISAENAHHLTVLVSISAELRLRTYIANGGQNENLSALASLDTAPHGQEPCPKANKEVKANVLKPLFHLQDKKQIFRYYYTASPLKMFLSDEKQALHSFTDIFHDNSFGVRGVMYSELCDYSKAISYLDEALKEAEVANDSTKMMYMLHHLGNACCCLGDYQNAITYMEKAQTMHRTGVNLTHGITAAFLRNLGTAWKQLGNAKISLRYFVKALHVDRGNPNDTTAEPGIAITLSGLAGVWTDLGDNTRALSFVEQALQMLKGIYGENASNPEIATALSSLGAAWDSLGDYKKSVTYVEQALQMFRSIYGQSSTHPHISFALATAGTIWQKVGDHRKAISYHNQALQIHRSIYGHDAAHPDFATLFGNLGSVWNDLGDYRKSLSCHEQALQMLRSIYGLTTAHPSIAQTLNDLGDTCVNMGDHRQAIAYHEQALQMLRSIYDESTPHPRIAGSISKLGLAWCQIGYYRKAITYTEQALQMFRGIWGHTTDHHNIASELNNLGVACISLGDFEKAISYHEEALRIEKSIHGQGTGHPDIAMSLSNLGLAWHHLCHYKKAISYYDEALQIARCSYGTTHPLIANTLGNLGGACSGLGDHRKAISYHEQSLKIFRSIHGQGRCHPRIATTLNNIGLAWLYLSDYKKAISHFEKALPMFRSVFGHTAAHIETAKLLNNLGMAFYHVGEYGAAIRYLQETLAMAREIFPQNESHPFIRDVEKNLTVISVVAVRNM